MIAWIGQVSAFAQGETTSAIVGSVSDPAGAAIPGATVSAVMTEQQTTRTQQSDAQGFYNFIALPAVLTSLATARKEVDSVLATAGE